MTSKMINIKKYLLNVIIFLLLIIMAFSIYKIYKWNLDNKNTKDQIEDISKIKQEEINTDNAELVNEVDDKNNDYWNYIKLPLIDVNFDELLKKNSDTVAFIKVNGTNINYPVVQTSNNDYYLSHSYNKKKNDAGWVFMDYRNSINPLDQNTILYAHGRVDTTMFGSLKNVFRNNWYQKTDNYILHFITKDYTSLWQIFSVYSIPTETYYLTTNFSTDEEYQKFIDTLTSRSKYNFNASVNTNDKIITLSTCLNNNERVVLHARLIKIANK